MGTIFRNGKSYGNSPFIETIGVGGGYAPIGTIISYMGTTAPYDYLVCDGTEYNITAYPQLAAHFESQFGSKNYFGGNGVTTFAVPDLQGEFLRGSGTNSHTNQGAGANVGVHQDGSVVQRSFGNGNNALGTHDAQISRQAINSDFILSVNQNRLRYLASSNVNTADNSGFAYTVRPTNTSVLYCIKARVFTEELHYSLEEQQIGFWIDEKPLYQKSFQFTLGTVPSSGANMQKLISIDSTYDVVDWVGYITWVNGSSGGKVPLGYYYSTTNFISISLNRTPSSAIAINALGSHFSNQDGVVTIQYTKTTD